MVGGDVCSDSLVSVVWSSSEHLANVSIVGEKKVGWAVVAAGRRGAGAVLSAEIDPPQASKG